MELRTVLRGMPEETLEPEEQIVLITHRLKQAREAKGMSQAALGELIGVHENTIIAFEKKRPPTLLSLLRMCKALEVTVASLLDETA